MWQVELPCMLLRLGQVDLAILVPKVQHGGAVALNDQNFALVKKSKGQKLLAVFPRLEDEEFVVATIRTVL